MRFELKGKTALLTGASSGIGRALAKELARAGVRLAVSARRAEALASLADEIERAGGARPVVLPADLSKRGQARDLAARALASLGRVDLLVNNAGVGIGGAQHVVGDDEMAREMFETNYWSALSLIQALVPAMRERGAGAVVNVESMGAILPMPLAGHYASTKAALGLCSETLRLEMRGSGVHVFSVLPGPVETGMLAEYREVPGGDKLLARSPIGNADTIARKIVRGLERGRRVLVYPSSLAVMRHLPTVARRLTAAAAAGTVDIHDPRKLRGGSQGDPLALQARSAFDARG
jgi:short-subunit dehydrogenase